MGAGGPAMTMPRAPAPEPEPAWDDDIVYDDDEAAPPRRRRGRGAAASEGDAGGRGAAREEQGEAVSIYVGMRVRHARFGEGEVLGWAGLGDDLKLNLRFREHGTKTILARFCQPV
ncbi:MAG: hypothetical protein H6711_01635 [Myxococcales bacterium]|nr:hypothetical protein [Myxococcales bacterium]